MAAATGKRKAAEPDPRITKRKVTMRSVRALGVDDTGKVVTATYEATDYWDAARPGLIAASREAALKIWDTVEVGTEPDAGPGGYDGATTIPADLQHPLAGQHFPATEA